MRFDRSRYVFGGFDILADLVKVTVNGSFAFGEMFTDKRTGEARPSNKVSIVDGCGEGGDSWREEGCVKELH